MRAGIAEKYIPWLSSSSLALPSIIITIIWQGIPFFTLMLLASLQSVSHDVMEASEIDGATRLQRLLFIILPHLAPTIFITSIIRVIWVANSVDIIYIMTGGGPGYKTLTLAVHTYMTAQKTLNFGYASALSIYLSSAILLFLLLYIYVINRSEKVFDRE